MSLLTDRRAAPSAPRAWSVLGEPREAHLGYLLVLPAYLFIVGLTIFPILYAVYISLHRLSLTLPGMPFVGLANYVSILTAPSFWQAVAVTTYFVVISLLLQFPLGLAVALVLNEQVRGRAVLRAAILIPWAIAPVINGLLWQWIYNPRYGALNGLLKQLGVLRDDVLWLGEPFRALNMVILADTWKVLPFYVILFLAVLQTVPAELYEAAHIDGAGAWQRFRHVTLPFLRPIILVILVLRTVQTFRVFEIVYVLTGGGPAGGTTVIAFHVYRETFGNLNFGYGAALSFVMAFLTLTLAGAYVLTLRSEELY